MQRAEGVLPREAVDLLGHEEVAQPRHELRLREKVRAAAHLVRVRVRARARRVRVSPAERE